jgi:hypothetical protein
MPVVRGPVPQSSGKMGAVQGWTQEAVGHGRGHPLGEWSRVDGGTLIPHCQCMEASLWWGLNLYTQVEKKAEIAFFPACLHCYCLHVPGLPSLLWKKRMQWLEVAGAQRPWSSACPCTRPGGGQASVHVLY